MNDAHLPKKSAVRWASKRKKICWRSAEATQRYTENIFNNDADIWEELADDRPSWWSLRAKGAVSYEKSWLTRAENKQRQHKMFSVSSSSTQHHVCANCARKFCAVIGLFSHKRTHRGSADLNDNTSTWRMCHSHHPTNKQTRCNVMELAIKNESEKCITNKTTIFHYTVVVFLIVHP